MQTELDARIALDAGTDSVIAAYQRIAIHDQNVFAAYQQQEKLNTDEMASMRRQAKLTAIKSKILGLGIGIPTASAVGVAGFILGTILKIKL